MQKRGYAHAEKDADADRICTKNNMSPPPTPPMVGDIIIVKIKGGGHNYSEDQGNWPVALTYTFNIHRDMSTKQFGYDNQKILRGGRVVSTPNFGSWDLRFKSSWRRNSAQDCIALHCRKPFIITLPSSQYDLNNVERDVKHQISIIIIINNNRRCCFPRETASR